MHNAEERKKVQSANLLGKFLAMEKKKEASQRGCTAIT